MEEPSIGNRSIPLVWIVPAGTLPRYANHIVLQQIDQDFLLSFFVALPPIIVGTPKERMAQAEQVTTLQAECVAQIIITPQRLQQFLEVFTGGLQQLVTPPTAEEGGL